MISFHIGAEADEDSSW